MIKCIHVKLGVTHRLLPGQIGAKIPTETVKVIQGERTDGQRVIQYPPSETTLRQQI